MDSPQLSVTVSSKSGPCMEHGGVVRQQDISLFPFESQADPAIIEQFVNQLHNVLAVVLNRNHTSRELGLGCIPRLVPAHAWSIRLRVADN